MGMNLVAGSYTIMQICCSQPSGTHKNNMKIYSINGENMI